jgi:hypothetical protein
MKFTFEEFRNWILSQPDDRPVNMSNNGPSQKNDRTQCGCLLAQFGESKNLKFDGCSWNQLYGEGIVAEIEGCETLIRKALFYKERGVKNFGEAKTLLES